MGLERGDVVCWEKTWISLWLFPLFPERRMTSTNPGCQNFWWRRRIRTKGKAAAMWKGLDFYSVFSHIVSLCTSVSWAGCRSGMPLTAQTFCVGCCSRVLSLWIQLSRDFADSVLRAKQTLWSELSASGGFPGGLILMFCHVFHLAETKRCYLLYIHLLFCHALSHCFFNCALSIWSP